MKKIFVAAMAMGLFVGISGMASAVEGTLEGEATIESSIGVSAKVLKYAEINTADTDGILPDFTGSMNEIKRTSDEGGTNGHFTVETNTDVTVTVKGGTLTSGTSTIKTMYDLDGTDAAFNLTPIVSNAGIPLTVDQTYQTSAKDHYVRVGAQLGNISDQAAANDYAATVVITVAAADTTL